MTGKKKEKQPEAPAYKLEVTSFKLERCLNQIKTIEAQWDRYTTRVEDVAKSFNCMREEIEDK